MSMGSKTWTWALVCDVSPTSLCHVRCSNLNVLSSSSPIIPIRSSRAGHGLREPWVCLIKHFKPSPLSRAGGGGAQAYPVHLIIVLTDKKEIKKGKSNRHYTTFTFTSVLIDSTSTLVKWGVSWPAIYIVMRLGLRINDRHFFTNSYKTIKHKKPTCIYVGIYVRTYMLRLVIVPPVWCIPMRLKKLHTIRIRTKDKCKILKMTLRPKCHMFFRMVYLFLRKSDSIHRKIGTTT
jgi:hypothetical protein